MPGPDSNVPTDGEGNGASVQGTEVAGMQLDATNTGAEAANDLSAPNAAHDESRLPAFLIIFFALLVASLIGFVAMRLRSEDEDLESV